VEPRWLAPDASEPLGLWTTAPRTEQGAHRRAFELSSRGDRVPGELWRPDAGRAPVPLVLHQEAGGAAAGAEPAVAVWLAAGLAVASIDLPLHGTRASAKLSGLLAEAQGAMAVPEALARELLLDFARQAVLDLRRCLDALPRLLRLDARRVGFAGAGLAAALGAHLCAQEPRLRAAVLADAAGRLPAELEAAPPRRGIEVQRVAGASGLTGAPARAFLVRALGLAPGGDGGPGRAGGTRKRRGPSYTAAP